MRYILLSALIVIVVFVLLINIGGEDDSDLLVQEQIPDTQEESITPYDWQDIINDIAARSNAIAPDSQTREYTYDGKRQGDSLIEDLEYLWDSNISLTDTFLDENYIESLSNLDRHTQLFGYPLKVNPANLRNIRPGDFFALDIPQSGIKYTTEVVDVSTNGGIVSIHADLSRQEGEYNYSYEWDTEVISLTLWGKGRGEGAILTNNGTYDIKIHGNYSWITDHQTRPIAQTD